MNTPPEKFGLCLSGGGFRASLFHIGVLAALAERELLHRVSVLSTVSGGSIIGAYYYLKVKRLLEGRRPGCPTPTPEVYRQIVAEIERDFLAGVQKNIRLRLFLNPFRNARMLREDYSRSDHLAELLNRHFYDAAGGEPAIALRDIHIAPGGQSVDAEAYNAEHAYKIPILVINATCLNTGHPWHFTGSHVGEPEPLRGFCRTVDTNTRLPALRFDGRYHDERHLPPQQQRRLNDRQQRKLDSLTLADAVAASAAVPGIFPPLAIHDLYQNGAGRDIVVELADGGVFDNQGVDALFQHGCSHFMVSDACGQLEDQRLLGTRFFQVAQRANDVMMDKIRSETLYRLHAGQALQHADCNAGDADILALRRENGVCGFALVHLRQSCSDSVDYPRLPDPVHRPEGTVYRLSGLRTDLDAFSDAEAYALMYHGYNLTHEQIGASRLAGLGLAAWQRRPDWRFLALRTCLRDNRRLTWLHTRLKVGARQFFRPFLLTPWQAGLRSLVLLAPLAVLLWLAGARYGDSVLLAAPLTLRDALYAAGLGLLGVLLGNSGFQAELKRLPLLRQLRLNGGEQLLQGIVTVGAMLLGLGVGLYLWLFNPLFLKDGRIAPGEGKVR